MIPCILLSFLFAFLSGVSRGLHHARRDYPQDSKALGWISPPMYWGTGTSAARYRTFNQSYPWTADHAHQMMHFQVLGLALSGMFYALIPFQGFILSIVWVWLVWFVEGRGFCLFYHVVLPDSPSVPQYSLKEWIKGWIVFW